MKDVFAADLEALRQTCFADIARIDEVSAFLDDAGSRRAAGGDLTPEALIALADELDDPELLGRPALLRWNTIMRERRPFDAGV